MSDHKLPKDFPKKRDEKTRVIACRVSNQLFEKWQKLQFKTSDGKVNNSELLEYMIENLYAEVFENKETDNE
tara:strand:- start:91 stop:306 length:216 start_codon:yes stop_codon:yes gene_type:complete